MEAFTGKEFKHKNGETTYYYEGGSKDGPQLIFIHGWPDIAETWKHQLTAFSSLGFRVIAPDMRGYGKSSMPKERSRYALEILNQELLELLADTGRSEAVWIGHDWGVGVVASFVRHYPEACTAVAFLSVPYGVIERGMDALVELVNRDLYPESEYPYGQWEYMKQYELDADKVDKQLDPYADRLVKVLYTPADPATFGKPAFTARVIREGGFFGGDLSVLPDIPLEATYCWPSLYENLMKHHKERGFFPATSYYLNHPTNKVYDESRKNDGVLAMPVLFVDAKYDNVCSPATSPRLVEPQRKLCKNLTEVTIESGHWVHMEKPLELNAALAKWLGTELPKQWPYSTTDPFRKYGN